MRKFFAYSSKVVFDLPKDHEGLVEKIVLGLKTKLSAYSGEEAESEKNKIFFAVTPSGTGITFIGIDSGEVSISVQENKLLVHYQLSYLSPLAPFLVLDIFLIWLSCLFPTRFEVIAFAGIVSILLGLFTLGVFISIISFPGIVHGVWNSVNKK